MLIINDICKRVPFLIAFAFTVPLIELAFAQPPDTLWMRQYTQRDNQLPAAVKILDSGNYIVLLYEFIHLSDTSRAKYVILNESGDVLNEQYLVDSSLDAMPSGLDKSANGGFSITGTKHPEGIFLSIGDETNLVESTAWFDAGTYNDCYCHLQTQDSNYLLAGIQRDTVDPYYILTDSEGDTLWTYHRDLGVRHTSGIAALAELPEGGYVSAGFARYLPPVPPLRDSIAVHRLSSNGELLWERKYGFDGNSEGTCIAVHSDGNILVGGTSSSSIGRNVVVLKIDLDGEEIWRRMFTIDHGDELCSDIFSLANGDILIGGAYDSYSTDLSGGYLARMSSSGDSLWYQTYAFYSSWHILAFDLAQDNHVIMVGNTYSISDSSFENLFIMKLDQIESIGHQQAVIPEDIRLLKNYPNPFNSTTTISFDLSHPGMVKLKVFDVIGRLVSTLIDENMNSGSHQVMFNGAGLASGTYIIEMKFADTGISRRMAYVK